MWQEYDEICIVWRQYEFRSSFALRVLVLDRENAWLASAEILLKSILRLWRQRIMDLSRFTREPTSLLPDH